MNADVGQGENLVETFKYKNEAENLCKAKRNGS